MNQNELDSMFEEQKKETNELTPTYKDNKTNKDELDSMFEEPQEELDNITYTK